jgi:hypothetical protein
MTRIALAIAFAFTTIACSPLEDAMSFEFPQAGHEHSERESDDTDWSPDDRDDDPAADRSADSCDDVDDCWDRHDDQDEACGDWEEQEDDCLDYLADVDDYCEEVYDALAHGQVGQDAVRDCEDQRADAQSQLDEAQDHVDQFCGNAAYLEEQCEELEWTTGC